MKLRLVSVLMSAVFVAACGGGGGDAPINAPPPSGPIATSATYEAIDYVDSRTTLTAQANAQGARGFSYYSGLVLDETPLTTGDQIFTNFYAKDTNATYSYESLDLPNTRATLLTQLNAQGARGFAWYSALASGSDLYSFFVKASDASTFTYEFLDVVTTNADFLAQANAQGARGFVYSGGYSTGGSTFHIYGKVNASPAQYSYRLEGVPTTLSSLQSQLNVQGQSGYKFAGGEFFLGEPVGSPNRIRNLFVKDTNQNSTFEWRNLAPAFTPASLVAQANSQGLAGFRLFGNYGATEGSVTSIGTFYAKESNCTGILCGVNSPF